MFSLLSYPFVQHAFLAGSCVAIVAACIGYFLLIRGMTFVGHALSHIGFAGAAGALLLRLDPMIGLLTSTIFSGICIGLFGKRLREKDISIGVIMTFMLGLGALFISLYSGYVEQAYSILFGTILGISSLNVVVTAGFCLVTLIALAILFRPLLFSSFDPEVAVAKGVPVTSISLFFLCLVAITVSMSVQVVGVLLIFTLLVGPSATAIRLATNPLTAIGIAMMLGLFYTWIGIFVSFAINIPVSFVIATLSFVVYILVRVFFGAQKRRNIQYL